MSEGKGVRSNGMASVEVFSDGCSIRAYDTGGRAIAHCPAFSEQDDRPTGRSGWRCTIRSPRAANSVESVRTDLFGRVDRAFRELEEGERQIREMAGLARGSIRLGVSITSVLPELIGPFIQQHPSVHFRQILGPTAEMIQRLEDGDIDLWISSVQAEGRIWNGKR